MIEVPESYKIYNGKCIKECPSDTQETEENGKKTCKVRFELTLNGFFDLYIINEIWYSSMNYFKIFLFIEMCQLSKAMYTRRSHIQCTRSEKINRLHRN